jgi:methionine synthase II (cobalamin-independent)
MIPKTHNHSTLPADDRMDLAALMSAQERAGCDVVTDGFFYSRDPLWLAIELTSGAEPGPFADYFGAGFSVPTAIVRDHLHHERSAALEYWRAAQEKTQRPVKVVLPGPLTLAALSRDRGVYGSPAALCEAWATLLLAEVGALAESGVEWIQLDEPAILQSPNEIRFLRALLEPVWEARGNARILLSTWGPGALPLYAQLHSLPADVVGVDVVSNPGLLPLIGSVGASQELYFGLVRPEGSLPALAELEASLAYALKRYELPSVHFGPACGLTAVSPKRAWATLELISELARGLGSRES